jgi:hypothetical protein
MTMATNHTKGLDLLMGLNNLSPSPQVRKNFVANFDLFDGSISRSRQNQRTRREAIRTEPRQTD